MADVCREKKMSFTDAEERNKNFPKFFSVSKIPLSARKCKFLSIHRVNLMISVDTSKRNNEFFFDRKKNQSFSNTSRAKADFFGRKEMMS